LGVEPAIDEKHLDRAVLAARLQAENAESFRHDHALLAVVWWGDTLEELETLKSRRAARSLVRSHAADGAVEDLGRSAVVEWAGLFRVDDVTFVEEVVVPEL
jgi:hypothetical protein